MEVVRAKYLGFCFGVRRAIDMVLKKADEGEAPLYTLGPIIHNPQMVAMLKKKGIVPVDQVSDVRKGTVVFRTHGVKKEEVEYLAGKGLKTLDATCPFVKRVRQRALKLKKEGYRVVIAGDENHPEVKSVLSYLDNDGIVLRQPVPIKAKKIGVVSQTTLDRDTFLSVVQGLILGAEEIRIYNTICESTEIRQREIAGLSPRVDVMLVVGGKNSSNTTKLYTIAKKVQPNTYHIETEEEIRPEWFAGVKTVGITGGASTPDHIIEGVERRVKNF
jgi:(E)-4-hydroxy-3-methyl-but-2-enyl pyrophosphate reductase